MINVYQPTLGKEELAALEKVFESNWLGKGKRVGSRGVYHVAFHRRRPAAFSAQSPGLSVDPELRLP